MIAKLIRFACLIGFASASGWHGSDYSAIGYGSSIGYGHGGYSTYVSPSYAAPLVSKAVYAAPVVAKAVVPAYSYAPYAPAISTVSRYQVHSSPIIKSYVAAPVVKSYIAAPVVKSYVAAPIVKSYVAPVSSYSSYSSAYPIAIGHGYSSGNAGISSDYLGSYSGYGYGGYGSKYLW
ncbi:unnamed protein product [Arctia plantaginis]|uniref:Cuticle protein 16.5-like n=1 Tax=Arctia plantaginis TaxID=874455 RepID=A0A8S1B8T8_ARCPL|nr:unnamed protein product [Arctia plantaginis]